MTGNSLAVILVAGGTGTRMKADLPKQFLKIDGEEIILHTLKQFVRCGVVDGIVIVCHKDFIDFTKELIKPYMGSASVKVVAGGESRQESVLNGLKAVADFEYVLIHDAVRCCIDQDSIHKLCNVVRSGQSCALGVRVKDTVKLSDNNANIVKTVNRENLWQIQTPQAFCVSDITNAHLKAASDKFYATDDCAVAEYVGMDVKIIEGSYDNIKITTPIDIHLAHIILKERE